MFAARVLLGTTFLLAGLSKMRDRRSLPGDIEAFTGLPPRLAGGLAVGLPVVELALAGWLLTGLADALTFGLAVALLLAFTAVVLRNMAAGRRVSCACFGSRGDRPVGPLEVVRNLALLSVAGVGLGLTLHPLATLSTPTPGQRLPVTIGTLAGLLTLALATAAGRVHRSLYRWQKPEIAS